MEWWTVMVLVGRHVGSAVPKLPREVRVPWLSRIGGHGRWHAPVFWNIWSGLQAQTWSFGEFDAMGIRQ